MLDLDTRIAILRLHDEGHGSKTIAKAMRVSRNAVKRVLRSGLPEVQGIQRTLPLEEHIERIRALYVLCGGNMIRVHEELASEGIDVGYSTLTRFCKQSGISKKARKRTGRYPFKPGEEMQHDTSPHLVKIGDRQHLLQCASLILCYSRMLYTQCFFRWSRFEARVFLSEGIQYLKGAAATGMIDNSSVIVHHGTGENAVMAPEMEAFSEHFGFIFKAHEKGDANRSAHVERSFHTIERNFYPGREFTSLEDLNTQLQAWCDTKNARWTRHLQHSPRELHVVEQPALKELPLYIPEIYTTHDRRVDTEGYVRVHTNRYSLPESMVGRRLVVHEHFAKIRVFDGHKLVTEHKKFRYGGRHRSTHPDHKYKRRRRPEPKSPQEQTLTAASPVLGLLVVALRKRHGGRALRSVRQLHRLYQDYPTEVLVAAVRTALEYGLLDVSRIETIVLQRIAGDFFRLPIHKEVSVERRSKPTDKEPKATDDSEDPREDS